jgi:hypothetical protein
MRLRRCCTLAPSSEEIVIILVLERDEHTDIDQALRAAMEARGDGTRPLSFRLRPRLDVGQV